MTVTSSTTSASPSLKTRFKMLKRKTTICLGLVIIGLSALIQEAVGFSSTQQDPCQIIRCDEGEKCLSFATVCDGKPCHQPVCLSSQCLQPKRTGRCRARLRRWYFDATVLTCAVFNYGGCRGNRNRFISQHACERRCLLPAKS